MSEVVWILAVILVGLFGTGVSRRRWQKAQAEWQAAAVRLGLAYRRGGFYRGDSLEGSIDGFGVQIESYRKQEGKQRKIHTRISVDGMGRVPRDLVLGTESLLSSIEKAFGGQDLLTGDADFDSAVRVRGRPVPVAALLSSRTRQLVSREVCLHGVAVRDGAIRFEMRGLPEDAAELVSRVRGMLELTAALAMDEAALAARLSENATNDTNPRVQLRNLALLLTPDFGGSELTRSTCRTLLGSHYQEVRLRAAQSLGAEGLETLRSLAEDEEASPSVRGEALAHLIGILPPEQLGPILQQTLRTRHPELRRTGIEAIGRLRYRPALEALVAAGEGADAEMLGTVVAALEQVGDPAAEPALLRWLAVDSTAVRIGIARALGHIGTVAAVEPLLPLTRGLLADGDLKHAAHEAVEAIQSRLGDVEEGRLTLADPTPADGALSLSEEGGALSIADGQTEPPPPPAARPEVAEGPS